VAVLIHGLGDGAGVWDATLRAWPISACRPAMIAVELPGHGESDWWDGSHYNAQAVSECLEEVVFSLGLHRPIIIGHSLGANIALRMGANNVLNPRALILIELSVGSKAIATHALVTHIRSLISGDQDKSSFFNRLVRALPLADPYALRSFIESLAHDQDGRCWVPHDPQIECYLEDAPMMLADDLLSRVVAPVGLIRGAFSAVMAKGVALKLVQKFSAYTSLQTIDRAGHAVLLEQPAAVARALAEMIGQLTYE